jgi:hypothetical protein
MIAELYSFLALAMGFAVAGMICTGYQLVANRPASFKMLNAGPSAATVAAVPFLAFAAPFIITRNVVRSGMSAPQRIELVLVATIVAGMWSLMSGTVVMMGVIHIAKLLG